MNRSRKARSTQPLRKLIQVLTRLTSTVTVSVKPRYSLPGTIAPDLTAYVDQLKAVANDAGGMGNSVTVATRAGQIKTTGPASHGIFAESTGRAGGAGANGGGFWSFGTEEPTPGGDGNKGGAVTVYADGTIITQYQTTLDHPENASVGIYAHSAGGDGGQGGDGGTWYNGRRGGTGGEGGTVQVNGGATITTGDSSGNYGVGIFALSEGGNGGDGGDGGVFTDGQHGGYGGKGGTVLLDGTWNITTKGDNAPAIWAKSAGGNAGAGGSGGWFSGEPAGGGPGADGGTVTVKSGGTISTSGNDAYGIYAQSVGGFGGSGGGGGSIFYTHGGSGDSAGSGGTVTVTNEQGGSITTYGQGAHGIYAESIGGGGGAGIGGGGAVVSVGGDGGAGGNGGAVTVTNDGSIRTYGDDARGIYAHSVGGGGGSGGGSGGAVFLGGSGSAAGNGGSVTVTNTGTIETGTYEPGTSDPGVITPGTVIEGVSSAIHAQSIGGGGGSGAGSGGAVSIGGNGSSGGDGGDVSVTNNGTLITWADFSRGILAQSVGAGGGDGAGSGGAVSLGGSGSAAGNGGTVTVVNTSSVTTHGDYSDGIYVQNIGGGGGSGAGSGGAYSVGGNGSRGGNGGAVTVTNSGNITVEGYRSRGIFAQSIGGGGGDGAGSGGIISCGGSGSASGNGGNVTVTNTGTIETGTYEPGTSDPGVITPGTVIEGVSSAIQAQSIGGGGGSGAGSGGVLASVGGNGAAAGNGGDVSVTNNGTLITWADFSRGILAQSVGGGGGDGAVSGGLIALGGSTGDTMAIMSAVVMAAKLR